MLQSYVVFAQLTGSEKQSQSRVRGTTVRVLS